MDSESTALRERIRQALEEHNNGTVTILSSLLATQDALGYIPPKGIEEVAEFTGSTINDVWGVASFYTNFRFEPPGDHVVEVCWGPTCHLMGATGLIKEVLGSLGLEAEGDTPDRKVTVKYNTCLGACAHAPVMSVDGTLVGKATPEEAKQRLQRLQALPGDA